MNTSGYARWIMMAGAAAVLAGALLAGCKPKDQTAGATQAGKPAASAASQANASSEPAAQATKGKGAIVWTKSLSEGLAQAAAAKKPLMVDFYADWCGWCQKLDKETYTDPKVQAKAEQFICVKVNADQDSANAQRYRANGLPTIVFLDVSGKELHRVEGYEPAADFVKEMDTALAVVKGT